MKEFLKTNRFCISVAKFNERLDDLSLLLTPLLESGIINGSEDDRIISATIDELRTIIDETGNKGNEIIEEIIEACPDKLSFPNQLKSWIDDFDKQIGNLNKPDICWLLLTHSTTKGKVINSLISRMWDNIENVAECVRYYANKYDVDIEEITIKSGAVVDSEACKKEEANDIESQKFCKTEKSKISHSFRDLIQYEDPDALLKRLHFLIDGKKRPMDIGLVICNAVHCMNYLKREPGQKEFCVEFPDAGKWTSIRKYFHMYDDPEDKEKEKHDQDLSERASQIVIFD